MTARDVSTLRNRIAELMTKYGGGFETLAYHLKINRHTLSAIYYNDRPPRPATLEKLGLRLKKEVTVTLTYERIDET